MTISVSGGRSPDLVPWQTMREWIVPLADVNFSAEEVKAVADTYRSGWLSQGPKVAAFEAAFAEYLGCGDAVAVASGTAALHLICVAIGLQPGDQVVMPSLTFAATAAAVLQTGARPVFADIRSPSEPWLSADAAETAIGSRTRAIINVSYGGHPGEVRQLSDLASSRGLMLIEDAAHGLGSRVGRRPVGTIGEASAFSFFANKNLPLGEGGMLVTGNAAVARGARLLRSHGLTSDTWSRHHGDEVDYDIAVPGFNYRLDEARAALGTLMLGRITADNDRRAAVAEAYSAAIESVAGVRAAIAGASGVSNAWHIYPLLLDGGVDRSAFRARLAADGIQTSVHYPPLHLSTAFAGCSSRPLPVTEEYARRTVTVPMFPHITAIQQAQVIASIVGALQDIAV